MNRYEAAWRAECCKADIEMGFLDSGKVYKHHKSVKHMPMSEYMKKRRQAAATRMTASENINTVIIGGESEFVK